MSARIEDYAMIGDCHTSALVSREGSIDWLCLPRFDSAACFAALLGGPEHGRWLISPAADVCRTRRRYRDGTLILETDFETADGAVRLIDFMPLRDRAVDLVRIVEGRRGKVPLHMELIMRFDYGHIVPWVRRSKRGLTAVAGPDMLQLEVEGSVELRNEDFKTCAAFDVAEGQQLAFRLIWCPSHRPTSLDKDPRKELHETEHWWRQWSDQCRYDGRWPEPVKRSLITLKALTYEPTGGIVAAPTTSLPEKLGGVRNWDYRYCWLRDATFTLYALLNAGYHDAAAAWREWLLRAIAGKASQLQIMYGIAGERRIDEQELPWLPGYAHSAPVRIGNGARGQFQLDVFGEVLDTLHQCWRTGLAPEKASWHLERELLDFLEGNWHKPDMGIWEVRGPKRHFTHSRMMAWVAMDRAIKGVEDFGLEGPVERWRALRDKIHTEVCEQGYHPETGTFVQYYGSRKLDASLLMMPLVGFLPATDPRVRHTIEAIEQRLTRDGFVIRYEPDTGVDGLPAGEGAFLLCTFWLVDNLALLGRDEDARRLFERLLALRNDVGLLSEAYDADAKRLLGNFPQAFSHVGLINSAYNLSRSGGSVEHRRSS